MLKEEYEELKKFINDNDFGITSTDGGWHYVGGRVVKVDDILSKLERMVRRKHSTWVKINKTHPLPKYVEVLAYNEKWIDPDFNPNGIRIGVLGEDGFTSAVWESESDTYTYCWEEGDDFETSTVDEDGTYHTYYINKYGEEVEGHRPNLPTHYMLIPKCEKK